MKIAAVSEDGVTISRHFGKAVMYVVIEVEGGEIVNREKRLRTSVGLGDCHNYTPSDCQERHGDPRSSVYALAKHFNMADAIADCQIIITGGMGYGAYASLKSRNFEPIITDQPDIDQAIKLLLDGKLENLVNKIH